MTCAVQGSGGCLGQCLVFQQPGLCEGVRHLPFHCGQQREHILGKDLNKDKLSRFFISGEPARERRPLAVPRAGLPPEVLCLKATVVSGVIRPASSRAWGPTAAKSRNLSGCGSAALRSAI